LLALIFAEEGRKAEEGDGKMDGRRMRGGRRRENGGSGRRKRTFAH
jgi:hypothetical protein